MLRAARFVTKFFIGVLIALVLTVLGLAVTASPNWIQVPIPEVVIAAESPFSVRIPNSALSYCESGGQQERCQVQIAGQPLTVTALYANNSKQDIAGCQSFYQSRSLRCSAGFDYAGAQLLPSVAIFSSLGLSQPQLQSLRTRYWLAQWTEPQWFRLTTGLSVAAALLTALAIGLSHQKTYIPLVSACISAGIAGWCLWLGALYWLPIAALATVVLLGAYGLQFQLSRGLTGILSGMGVFGCSWFFALWSLLSLRLAD
jgi:hypothetical protein